MRALEQMAEPIAYACLFVCGLSACLLLVLRMNEGLLELFFLFGLYPLVLPIVVAAFVLGLVCGAILWNRPEIPVLALAPALLAGHAARRGCGRRSAGRDRARLRADRSLMLAIASYGVAAIAISLRELWRAREPSRAER